MNRSVATLATIVAVLGLTACSSAPSAPVTAGGPVASVPAAASAPAQQPSASAEPAKTGEQSLSEACLEPSAKLAEASAELAEVSAALAKNGGKDPKDTVKAISKMADYFGKAGESSSNPKVKKALIDMQKGYKELSALLEKVLVKKDYSAAAGTAKIMADLQKSITAFQQLCTA